MDNINNIRPEIASIISSIDSVNNSINGIMTDYGDVNYDKSLDIKADINGLLDKVSSTTFVDNNEREQVKQPLSTKLRPGIENLKQFYIYRKNYLSADYDVQKMTGQLQPISEQPTIESTPVQEPVVQEPQTFSNDNTESQEQSPSQTQEKGKVLVRFNPNAGPVQDQKAA